MRGSRNQIGHTYPSLDPRWAEDVLVILRMREVSGARIGQILAEANEHCASSGESAQDAFGSAASYAESLDFDGQDRARDRVTPAYLARLGAMLVGAVGTSWAGTALIEGTSVRLRAAEVLVVALTLTAAGLAYRRLSWLLTHLVLGALAFGAFVAGLVVLFVWGGPQLALLPAVPVLIGGLVLLIGPAVADTPRALAAPTDVVAAPGADPDAREARTARLIGVCGVWLLPVAIVAMLLVPWAVRG